MMNDPRLGPYASLAMELQGILIEGCLTQAGSSEAVRREVTREGARLFHDLVSALKPEVIVEIGAHEARFSRLMKRKRPQARVVAFEANPEVYERHKPNAAAAGIEYVFKCIAAENGKLQFYVPVAGEPRLTMGSLMQDSTAEHHATYEVEGVTLDEFLGADTQKPNALWIDVEGAVGTVLLGAEATLDACRAVYVELETRQRWAGQLLAEDIYSRLAAFGLFPILRDVQRKSWQFNAIFLHETSFAKPNVRRLCTEFVQRQVARADSVAGPAI